MKHLDLSFDWLKMLFFDVLCWIGGVDKWSTLRRESNGVFKIVCKMRRASFKLPELFWFWTVTGLFGMISIWCFHMILKNFNL